MCRWPWLLVTGQRGSCLAGEKLHCTLVFVAPLLARPLATIANPGLMPLVSLAWLAITVRRARADTARFSLAQAVPAR